MKFKKDGNVYNDIDALLHETCFAGTHYHCGSCMIRDEALKEQDSCYTYAAEHQRETARYFGFEVIEDDAPDTAETVEENSEDAKPKRRTFGVSNLTEDMTEYVEKYLEAVKPDPVNRPAHYTSGGIECIDAMQAAFGVEAVKDFCLCNSFKYLWRHRNKNGVEDLKKARWYLNRLIREMEVTDDDT